VARDDGCVLDPLPHTFLQAREALRSLACYVIAPARKASTGRIGLRSTGDGFGTPPFDGGTRIVVRGDRIMREPDLDIPITTLRAAAEALGVALSPDPGVGHDLPPFEPDAPLAIDVEASNALGRWYAFGDRVLGAQHGELMAAGRGTASEIQLWPEHFDIAFDWGLDDTNRVGLGASPGDAYQADPYLYASPWAKEAITEDHFWNAPFGAAVPYTDLLAARDPISTASDFFGDALRRLAI
jgi:hypothetical protein